MSYPLNIKDCIKGPSKGGLPIKELRVLAKQMGLEIKGRKKVEICGEIEKILNAKTPIKKQKKQVEKVKIKAKKVQKILLERSPEKNITTLPKSDFWLDNLPEQFYKVAYYPEAVRFASGEERPNMDKIGGDMPFLLEGEEWPGEDSPYQFAFQLTLPDTPKARAEDLPGRGKTVRVFFDPEMEEEDLHISLIDYSKPFQKNPQVPKNNNWEEKYPAWKVVGWRENQELDKDADLGILKELSIEDKEKYLPKGYEIESLEKDFLNPPKEAQSNSKSGIKFGGFPQSWQRVEYYYLENDQRLQFDEDKYLPWSWGDGGMIHINPEEGTYAGDMG